MPLPYRHVFGPVPSRRFGRSLGIDLRPYKTCSQDCVYCQLGPTTNRTLERREYVPTDEVPAELSRVMASDTAIDYVTLSGCGEPTLHTDFGRVLEAVKSQNRAPTHLDLPHVLG